MVELTWSPVSSSERLAVAVYSYEGDHLPAVSFTVGDTLYVSQRCGDWCYGTVERSHSPRSAPPSSSFSRPTSSSCAKTPAAASPPTDPASSGVFPVSYIRFRKCAVIQNLGTTQVVPIQSPLEQELTSVIREWSAIVPTLYLTLDEHLDEVVRMVLKLVRLRRQIMSPQLPADELRQLKHRAISIIDSGNVMMRLDLMVRDNNDNVVNADTVSLIELYRHHQRAADRPNSATMAATGSSSSSLNNISSGCVSPVAGDDTTNNNNSSGSGVENYHLGPCLSHGVPGQMAPAPAEAAMAPSSTTTAAAAGATANANELNGADVSQSVASSSLCCLLLTFDTFIARVEDDCELVFYLYDTVGLKAVSENYVVLWSKNMVTRDLEQLTSMRVLFTDVKWSEWEHLVLACHIVKLMSGRSSSSSDASAGGGRKWNANYSFTSSATATSAAASTAGTTHAGGAAVGGAGEVDVCRRAYGVSMFDLAAHFNTNNSSNIVDSHDNLFMFLCQCNERECLDDMLRKLIKDAGRFKEPPRDSKTDAKGICFSLRLLRGDLSQVRETHSQLLAAGGCGGSLAVALRQLPADVPVPNSDRNDLYLTLESADLSRLFKGIDKNIEVTATVVTATGRLIPGAIYNSAGVLARDSFSTIVYRHNSRPTWRENFIVKLTVQQFNHAFLLFTIKHRSFNENKEKSDKLAAICSLCLKGRDREALNNGFHELAVYKLDGKRNAIGSDLSSFLQLPQSRQLSLANNDKTVRYDNCTLILRDVLVVHSQMCSDTLTQNANLLRVLECSGATEDPLQRLDLLQQVTAGELVRFLPLVLDVLFSVLDDVPNSVDSVFKALVTVVMPVVDSRYSHFKSVLDDYIADEFSSLLIGNQLLNPLNSLLEDANNSEHALIENALHCLPFILKFTLRSCNMHNSTYGVDMDKSFDTAVLRLLTAMETVSKSKNYLLHNIQLACLGCLPETVETVAFMCTHPDFRELVANILRGGAGCDNNSVQLQRLQCARQLVVGSLFLYSAEIRAPLLAAIVQLVFELISAPREKMSKAVDLLSEVLDRLWSMGGAETQDMDCLLNGLLLEIMRVVIKTSRDDTIVCNLVAVLLAMLRQMRKSHYDRFMTHLGSPDSQLDFVIRLLILFQDLITRTVFPSRWCQMIMVQSSVILKLFGFISHTIRDRFMDPFRMQLCSNFFHCAIAFVIQPSLQLDNFSPIKRSRLLQQYKDMRRLAAREINTMWISLGQHKIEFVPSVVGPFLEMTMVPDEQLRVMSVPLFFDMMQCEFYSPQQPGVQYTTTKRDSLPVKCNFDEFRHEMLIKLDHLTEGGKGDIEYLNIFRTKITELCAKHSSMKTQGLAFVEIFSGLMERLFIYRDISRQECDESLVICTADLMRFYLEVGCTKMHIRYMFKLMNLYVNSQNFIEAGFTMKLLFDKLNWNEEQLSPELRHPKHPTITTHRQLKVRICNDIIDWFDKGCQWQTALDFCCSLCSQFERVFDYTALSDLHARMAQLYGKIVTETVQYPDYFRVGFYGLGFPFFIQNKVYVYRGRPYERIGDFAHRIQSEFPQSELLKSLALPSADVTQSAQQYLQINKVDPEIDENALRQMFDNVDVADCIVDYYKMNRVNRFTYSRPMPRGVTDKENPFANLWLERTLLRTEHSLPDVMSSARVLHSSSYDVTPLENAVETMKAANSAIRQLTVRYGRNSALPLNPLTQKLTGVIDAAVMGGVSNYEKAFFTEEYSTAHPQEAEMIDRLKMLIKEQIPLLEAALQVHGTLTPASLQPLHERLEKLFAQMKRGVTKFGGQTVDATVASHLLRTRSGSCDSHRRSTSSTASTIERSSVLSCCDSVSSVDLVSPESRAGSSSSISRTSSVELRQKCSSVKQRCESWAPCVEAAEAAAVVDPPPLPLKGSRSQTKPNVEQKK